MKRPEICYGVYCDGHQAIQMPNGNQANGKHWTTPRIEKEKYRKDTLKDHF